MNDTNAIFEKIQLISSELGFDEIAVAKPDVEQAAERLREWLGKGYAGDMDWMHEPLRQGVKGMHPETKSLLVVRLNYDPDGMPLVHALRDKNKAAISRYALGRDYHKVLRKKLKKLAEEINKIVPHSHRVYVDSAPIMEKPLAEQAGLGFYGRNTLIIHPQQGSYFFIGVLATSLELQPNKKKINNLCGNCRACRRICPTDAIVDDNVIDARKCISYLTIEHKGDIPEEFRAKIGNRIYGCDDCQIICPFNRAAPKTTEADFRVRHNLDDISLLTLWSWDEQTFLDKTEGTPIRRVGYERFMRNIAVALGNSPVTKDVISALKTKPFISALVSRHIEWALAHLNSRSVSDNSQVPRWILKYHP